MTCIKRRKGGPDPIKKNKKLFARRLSSRNGQSNIIFKMLTIEKLTENITISLSWINHFHLQKCLPLNHIKRKLRFLPLSLHILFLTPCPLTTMIINPSDPHREGGFHLPKFAKNEIKKIG